MVSKTLSDIKLSVVKLREEYNNANREVLSRLEALDKNTTDYRKIKFDSYKIDVKLDILNAIETFLKRLD